MLTLTERIARRRRETALERRASTPQRLLLGLVAGLFAGALLIGLTMWSAAAAGQEPTAPLMLISTLVLGADAVDSGQASAWLGAGTHAVLSELYGLLFALVVPLLRAKDNLPSIGALYGGLIFWVNFIVLGNTAAPQFETADRPLQLGLHILFGLLVAACLALPRPSAGPAGHALTPGHLPARVLGALCAAGIALVHLALAGEHLGEQYYIGALFVLGSATMTYVGVQLVRGNDALAWIIGAITALLMLVSIVLSRTVGLPRGYLEPGFSGWATATVLVEAVFLIVAGVALLSRRRPGVTA